MLSASARPGPRRGGALSAMTLLAAFQPRSSRRAVDSNSRAERAGAMRTNRPSRRQWAWSSSARSLPSYSGQCRPDGPLSFVTPLRSSACDIEPLNMSREGRVVMLRMHGLSHCFYSQNCLEAKPLVSLRKSVSRTPAWSPPRGVSPLAPASPSGVGARATTPACSCGEALRRCRYTTPPCH